MFKTALLGVYLNSSLGGVGLCVLCALVKGCTGVLTALGV